MISSALAERDSAPSASILPAPASRTRPITRPPSSPIASSAAALPVIHATSRAAPPIVASPGVVAASYILLPTSNGTATYSEAPWVAIAAAIRAAITGCLAANVIAGCPMNSPLRAT